MPKQKTEPRLSLNDIRNSGFDRQSFRERKIGNKKVYEGTTITDDFVHVGITYELDSGELSIKNTQNQQLFLGKVTNYDEFDQAMKKADEESNKLITAPKSEVGSGSKKKPASNGSSKEKPAPKKPKEEVKKETPKFKKGDKVAIAVHGAGVTSYEAYKVDRIEKDKVYLEDHEFVFGQDGEELVPEDMKPFRLGFVNKLIPKAEVPRGEISSKEWKNL